MNDTHVDDNKNDDNSYDETLHDDNDNTVTSQSRRQSHRPLHETSHKLYPHSFSIIPILFLPSPFSLQAHHPTLTPPQDKYSN